MRHEQRQKQQAQAPYTARPSLPPPPSGPGLPSSHAMLAAAPPPPPPPARRGGADLLDLLDGPGSPADAVADFFGGPLPAALPPAMPQYQQPQQQLVLPAPPQQQHRPVVDMMSSQPQPGQPGHKPSLSLEDWLPILPTSGPGSPGKPGGMGTVAGHAVGHGHPLPGHHTVGSPPGGAPIMGEPRRPSFQGPSPVTQRRVSVSDPFSDLLGL